MLREALEISSPLALISGEVPRFHGGSLWHSTPCLKERVVVPCVMNGSLMHVKLKFLSQR